MHLYVLFKTIFRRNRNEIEKFCKSFNTKSFSVNQTDYVFISFSGFDLENFYF